MLKLLRMERNLSFLILKVTLIDIFQLLNVVTYFVLYGDIINLYRMIQSITMYVNILKILNIFNGIHGPPFKLAGFSNQLFPAFSEATDSCTTLMEWKFW